MLTKLTLTIDKEIVEKAKKYAEQKHRSVSRIVEEYLSNISDTERIKNASVKEEGSLTNSITGMFKTEYKGQSYKELLEESLVEKYS
jgi:predicted transcriptional regulator